jgi:type IV pilus assembly protein PilA
MYRAMIDRLRAAQAAQYEGEEAESGFTLIELMVVLLIIAILLAIAIPTFLGVTQSANDRAAQSNLTNGLTEATAQYQALNQSYANVQAALQTSAPEFTWNAGTASTGPNVISVEPFDVGTSDTNDQGVMIAALSKTGTCWYVVNLQQNPSAGAPTGIASLTTAGTFYAETKNVTAANCSAAYGLAPTSETWGQSYSTAGTIG